MIKMNGRKVYKNKIEDALNKLTFVKMIKLKKAIHNKFGEYFVAYVVINEDYDKNTAVSELQDYCKRKFDKYVAPKKFIILENMKLNSNQKVVLEESK
jgi:acyl-CoA synthetase (AMP-forming)/AMP-acid ligase II